MTKDHTFNDAQPTRLTDQELRKLWRDAGGEFYGPRVETGSMPEAKLLPFLRALAPQPSPAATVDRSEWAINGAHEFAETMRAAPVDHLLQKAVFASGEIVQDHLPDCSAGSRDDLAGRLRRYAASSDDFTAEEFGLLLDAATALTSTEPQAAPVTRGTIAKAICCPNGCVRDDDCLADERREQREAVDAIMSALSRPQSECDK